MTEETIVHRYLAPKAAASYLGLSVWSLYRLVERRAIPFIPLRPSRSGAQSEGRPSLRFDTAALDLWMKKQTVRPVAGSVVPETIDFGAGRSL